VRKIKPPIIRKKRIMRTIWNVARSWGEAPNPSGMEYSSNSILFFLDNSDGLKYP